MICNSWKSDVVHDNVLTETWHHETTLPLTQTRSFVWADVMNAGYRKSTLLFCSFRFLSQRSMTKTGKGLNQAPPFVINTIRIIIVLIVETDMY